jgi:hypothetical protein
LRGMNGRAATLLILVAAFVAAFFFAQRALPPAKTADTRFARAAESLSLPDLNGKIFTLRDGLPPETKFVVLFSQGNGCPIARQGAGKLEQLRKKFGPRGVFFVMINANPQDSIDEIKAEAARMGTTIPILRDEAQAAMNAFGFQRTAHALLIRTDGWALEYAGAVDDSQEYGGSRPGKIQPFLENALDEVLAGKDVSLKESPVKGCLIGKLS